MRSPFGISGLVSVFDEGSDGLGADSALGGSGAFSSLGGGGACAEEASDAIWSAPERSSPSSATTPMIAPMGTPLAPS